MESINIAGKLVLILSFFLFFFIFFLLTGNEFGNEGLILILDALKINKTLKHINLNSKDITLFIFNFCVFFNFI